MTKISVNGLIAPAEIRIDRWGIPHISAESLADLFFVQGFNAARDRLWQIDLWRKRGLGLLSADFGPGYLLQDQASRLFLYRGDMAAEWRCYGDDAETICTAFAEGINAYVGLVEKGVMPLPEEFERLGTRPARWRPEDVVRIRTHCLSRNATSEVLRANVLALAGAETDLLRANLAPSVPAEEWEKTAHVPLEALQLYELATAPVSFSPERLAATIDETEHWARVTARKEVVRADPKEGSNNWAIAGSRTESGRPIMASDPHRAHAVPSLRYLVHLTAPGVDLIGAGEPSSPGIMAGHNGHSAFSLTIFPADQEDVMVYETDPQAPDRYRYGGGFEEMVTVTETFQVKGAPDQKCDLQFTRHGPVIYRDDSRHMAVALRTVFTEPGSAPYMASLTSMRSKSYDSFKQAMAHWGAPTVNQVYADVAGQIGWLPAGYIPKRAGWRGLVPVSGDGRFEWQGFLEQSDKPEIVDPECGFVYSANEMNLPANWDHDALPVSFEWHEDGRAERIASVFGKGARLGIKDSCALQTDVHSSVAVRLVRLLPDDADDDCIAMLKAWDCSIDADSAAALLLEYWWSIFLKPALLKRVAADPSLRALLAPGNSAAILAALEQDKGSIVHEGRGDRAELLRTTLRQAHAALAEKFGKDTAAWRWGDLHKGYFGHALSGAHKGRGLDVGPLAKGGSDTTVMMAAYDPGNFHVTTGASVRMVIDVGAWDESVAINAPGQSGDPSSPHYADLAPIWAAGGYVPLLYSKEAVAAATETVIRLEPA
ncbi:MAG TPA: penicillin acylase family protein [Rhizobiaceae bacterium]|nr:penicillin acylase family protein [Rhizobiaceae bacterium]